MEVKKKGAGGQVFPPYNEMQQYQDLEKLYVEGFRTDGYFVTYSLMDRGILPKDLKFATPSQIKAATLYIGSGLYDRGFDSIAEGLALKYTNHNSSPEKQAAFKKTLDGKGFFVNRFLRSRNIDLMRATECCCLKAVGVGTSNNWTYNRSVGESNKLPNHWTDEDVVEFGNALIQEMGNKVFRAQPVEKEDLIELEYVID